MATEQMSLLPETPPEAEQQDVPTDRLVFTNQQPPSPALRRSVAALGVLQPLLVRPIKEPNQAERYHIVDGNRRGRAAVAAEMLTVPALVLPTVDAAVAAVAQLAQHATRSRNLAADLKSVEALSAEGHGPKAISQAVGLTTAQVDRLLRMTRLVPELREGLDAGEISAGVAEQAARLPTLSQGALVERYKEGGKLTGGDVAEQKTARATQALAGLNLGDFLAAAPQLPENEQRTQWISRVRQALDYVEGRKNAHARDVLAELLSEMER